MDEGFINWQHLNGQLVAAATDQVLGEFCARMGFDLEVCRWLGVGFLKVKSAITFPERDHEGNIVGISCRHKDSDRKWMITGSKHGIVYAPDPNFGGIPSYLDHPILVVEGATDVLACLTRNIYAIGKPSATGTTDSNAFLQELVRDRDIALVSENDRGVGAVAFLDYAKRYAKIARTIRSVTPPDVVKDIREWFNLPDCIAEMESQLKHRRPWDANEAIYLAGDILLDTAPLRVAESFVHECYNIRGLSTLKYWCGLWYIHNGKAYMQTEEQSVKSALWYWMDTKKCIEYKGQPGEKVAEEVPFTPTAQRVAGILEAIKSLNQVLVSSDMIMPCWLDSASHLDPKDMICFENGILNVKEYVSRMKCEFLAPSPQWFSQTYAPYSFSPSDIKHAKPVLEYLWTIWNNDEPSVLLAQEWFGYCMVPDNTMEKFMLMIGRPSAGKGTVLDIMTEVIGRCNIYFTRINAMGERFGLYGALGKTNIVMTDAHVTNLENAQNALEVIKTITGRGSINVEGKGMNAKDFLLPSRFTISVNEMPNFQDTAAALRRRLLVLWFPNSYEHVADPTLKDRLTRPEVIRGVAAWAMEGLRRLRTRRRFTEPEVSKAIAREFERTNTPVSSFIVEECIVTPGDKIEKKMLFAKWFEWCRDRGMSPGNAASFGQKLLSVMPTITSGRAERDRSGYRSSLYLGIRTRTPADG